MSFEPIPEHWAALRQQIEYFSKPFPRQAIVFANDHRDDVAPFLTDALAQMAANPSLADDGEYVLHLYAIHLLAAWRDTSAYGPMVALGHHSEDVLDVVMGDTITESYGRSLASVCDGNVEPLYALFEDTNASHWARNAALDALMVRVHEGDYSRTELIQYLIAKGNSEASRLRMRDTTISDLEILDCIVSVATDIAAVEMIEQIEGWFADDLLDTMIAGRERVFERIAQPFEVCRDRELSYGKGYVRDVEREMGWWAGFRDDQTPKLAPRRHPKSTSLKIGRNDPCPCGSGKKYKKCHGNN